MIRLGLVAAVTATLLAGCGGGTHGQATLWVTRDEGHTVLLTAKVPAGETALQALDRATDVTTRYGGRFVQSVNGLAGSIAKRHDWFYFVNGIEAPRGAAEYRVHPGDVLWWDYRDWGRFGQSMPIVVGAFPEPFLHGYDGQTRPTDVGYYLPSSRIDALRIAKEVHARMVFGPNDAGAGSDSNRIVIYPEPAELASIFPYDKGAQSRFELDLGPKTAARLARNPHALRFQYGELG